MPELLHVMVDLLHNLVGVHGFLFQKEQNQHFAQAVLQAFGKASSVPVILIFLLI